QNCYKKDIIEGCLEDMLSKCGMSMYRIYYPFKSFLRDPINFLLLGVDCTISTNKNTPSSVTISLTVDCFEGSLSSWILESTLINPKSDIIPIDIMQNLMQNI